VCYNEGVVKEYHSLVDLTTILPLKHTRNNNMQTNFIEWLGFIGGLSFILCFFYYALYPSAPKHSNDMFTIGYVEESPPIVVNTVVKVPESKEDSKLKKDCMDVLIKLGFRKRDARQKTKEVFAKCSPQSIQEFLKEAL
tara:strand:- start:464 stop:880 length:417 start_codon:yes stop_codon:yes gene_type:complete